MSYFVDSCKYLVFLRLKENYLQSRCFLKFLYCSMESAIGKEDVHIT